MCLYRIWLWICWKTLSLFFILWISFFFIARSFLLSIVFVSFWSSWLCVYVCQYIISFVIGLRTLSLSHTDFIILMVSGVWKSLERDRQARSSRSVHRLDWPNTLPLPPRPLLRLYPRMAYNHIRCQGVLAFWPQRINVVIHRPSCRITKGKEKKISRKGGIKKQIIRIGRQSAGFLSTTGDLTIIESRGQNTREYYIYGHDHRHYGRLRPMNCVASVLSTWPKVTREAFIVHSFFVYGSGICPLFFISSSCENEKEDSTNLREKLLIKSQSVANSFGNTRTL